MRWGFTRFVLESRTASAGTEFRNCAPGRWGLGLQLVGRMGEWSWLAAAGPVKCGPGLQRRVQPDRGSRLPGWPAASRLLGTPLAVCFVFSLF